MKTLQPCGTRAAQRRHKAQGKTCPKCYTRTPAPCGTREAKQRHKNRSETCETCWTTIPDRHPCGTRPAYRRHKANNETPCEPCTQANREHGKQQRRKEGIQAKTTTPELAAEIRFLLNAGEGHHRILTATGYEGRTKNLRDRLVKNGYADLANRIFNTWELAA